MKFVTFSDKHEKNSQPLLSDAFSSPSIYVYTEPVFANPRPWTAAKRNKKCLTCFIAEQWGSFFSLSINKGGEDWRPPNMRGKDAELGLIGLLWTTGTEKCPHRWRADSFVSWSHSGQTGLLDKGFLQASSSDGKRWYLSATGTLKSPAREWKIHLQRWLQLVTTISKNINLKDKWKLCQHYGRKCK